MILLQKIFRGTRIAWAFAFSIAQLVVERPANRQARAAWLQKLCRRILRGAAITWSVEGPIPMQGAVVSNHLTYVDILVHGVLRPCVFVAAIEIRRMPLFGWISMMAGTVYVVRGAGGSAARAAGSMVEGFHDGLPVVFFPEGGTSVGDEPLMPVRSGLLATALEAGASVTPGFIRYTLSPRDLAAGKTTRDDVHWGSQTLPSHLWNLLGLRAIHATIRFAEQPIRFSPEALLNRKIAAKETRDGILQLTGR